MTVDVMGNLTNKKRKPGAIVQPESGCCKGSSWLSIYVVHTALPSLCLYGLFLKSYFSASAKSLVELLPYILPIGAYASHIGVPFCGAGAPRQWHTVAPTSESVFLFPSFTPCIPF